MKRVLFVLWLLLGFSLMANAMPYSMETNTTGWMGVSVGISFWLPDLTPNLFFEAEYAAPPGFGLGITIIAGYHVAITVDGAYYYNPLPQSNFAIPLKLHLGLFENEFGASLSAGFKYYALPYLLEDNYEAAYMYFDAEATVNWIKNQLVFGVNISPGTVVNIK